MNNAQQIKTASGLNILVGLWLVLAPFIVGYWGSNEIVIGLIAAILALITLISPLRNVWLSWVNIIAGIWLVLSPFVLGYTGALF